MEYDVIIIGAGPAGTIAAAELLKQKLNVLIIEKESFPRFVIGESLLPRCMDILDETGFLPAIEKQNYQKKYGALFIRGEEECSFSFDQQFTEGWSWTWQVPRGSFDKVLADEVETMGANIMYETAVTDIKFSPNLQQVSVKDKLGNVKEIEAKFIIDSSGYGRVIPKLLNLDLPSSLDTRNSLFSHVVEKNRPGGEVGERITIIDKDKGVWIWIIPFSNDKTSIGVVAEESFFDKYEGNSEEILRSILSEEKFINDRFNDIEFSFEPKYVKGYSIGVKKLFGEGFVLTGNSTEFLDPIFSSGVTFAIESGYQAAKLVVKHINGEVVDWENSYSKYISQGVETFRSYVNAWYNNTLQTIFFVENENIKIKKQICSVLAGYVWDKKNPYVRNHKNAITTLSRFIKDGK